MRVPVKIASSRRHPVGRSNPTYAVDLTWQEMNEIKWALQDRLKAGVTGPNFRDSVSALAAVLWASVGRN
jgi:hypothetical protein